MKTILLVVTFNLSGILIQWHFVREFVVHWHFVPDILSGGILLVIHRHASFKDFTVLYCYNSGIIVGSYTYVSRSYAEILALM